MAEAEDKRNGNATAEEERVSWKRRGDFADGVANELLARIEAGGLQEFAELVKENPVREIVYASDGSDRAYFVKRFKTLHWRDVAKFVIRGSRAEQEWRMAIALDEARIPAVQVLAAGVKRRKGWPVEAYLVTRAIRDVTSLRDFGFDRLADPLMCKRPRWLNPLIAKLAQLTRRLHDRGFHHRDYHGGNILFRLNEATAGPRQVALYVIDLHSMRRTKRREEPVSHKRRVRMLGLLRNSLNFPAVSDTDRLRFLRAYLGDDATAEGLRAWAGEVEAAARRIQRRYLSSRTKRCLLESKTFTNEPSPLGRLYRRRAYSVEQLLQAVDEHHAAVQRGDAIKASPETNVSIVRLEDARARLCVKEVRCRGAFHRLKDLFRPSPARRSWVASQALQFRKAAAATAVALVEAPILSARSHYFITEEIEGAEAIDRYVKRTFAEADSAPFRARVCFGRAVADFLRRLHRQGVYHRDLKSSNLLVKEQGDHAWQFFLVDLAQVRFTHHMPEDLRMRNLAQLNASMPKRVGWADRLRCFRHYGRGAMRFADEADALRRVVTLTLIRSCVWLRSPGPDD